MKNWVKTLPVFLVVVGVCFLLPGTLLYGTKILYEPDIAMQHIYTVFTTFLIISLITLKNQKKYISFILNTKHKKTTKVFSSWKSGIIYLLIIGMFFVGEKCLESCSSSSYLIKHSFSWLLIASPFALLIFLGWGAWITEIDKAQKKRKG